MKFHSLEVFCEVARLGSFSRAGDSFDISQSAASQVVAHLEEQLGFRLLNRKRRPLELTREGQTYYHGCVEMLHVHRTTLERIRQQHEGLTGDVRVASIYSAGLHTLNSYIRSFLAEHSGCRVRLEYFHPSKVYSMVLDDEADLGVISYPRPHRELDVRAWVDEEMVVACPKEHPLANRGSVKVEELQGVSFVAFDRDLKIRRAVDRILRQHHVVAPIVSEFDNIETIKQALEISGAVSILPRPSIEREVQRETLAELRLENATLRRPVGIIHKRKKQLAPTAELFLTALIGDANGTS